MPVHVHVIVTGKRTGFAPIVPYRRGVGLQHYFIAPGVPSARLATYDVPTHEVRLEHGGSYDAVRFALRYNDDRTPDIRPCDTGLSHARVCHPRWIPGYRPHSFPGSSRPGAWQLLPGKAFLIHEGADRTARQVGGSIGCIEILDGLWNDFLAEIETIGKGTCAQIAAASRLKVTIELAEYPIARRRVT